MILTVGTNALPRSVHMQLGEVEAKLIMMFASLMGVIYEALVAPYSHRFLAENV